MNKFKRILSGNSGTPGNSSSRLTRQAPVVQMVPGQSLNACYFLMQIHPAVRQGLKDLDTTNPRHTLTEVALVSYLMGMGFDYRTALAIVASWETDDTLLAQGLLSD